LAIYLCLEIAVYWHGKATAFTIIIVLGNRCVLAWQGYGLHLYSLGNAC